jgi:arylsulfatase
MRNYVRKEEAFRTWDTYVEQAINWAQKSQKPFFLWLFSLDTHFPYLSPRDSRTWSNGFDQYYYNWKCNEYLDELHANIPEKDVKGMERIYDDSIYWGDKLLATLRDRLENMEPIFIIHGDHGEAFGENGMYGHFYPSLRNENVRVPLVIWDPKRDIEIDIKHPVSLLELPRIVSELAAGKVPEFVEKPILATTYDGRNKRDLVSYRYGENNIISEQNSKDEHIYETMGPNEEVIKLLTKLANDRHQHEELLMDIQQFSKKTTNTI